MKLEKAGKLKLAVSQSRYYKMKAVLSEITAFGKRRFLKLFSESKVVIPKRDCQNIKDEDIETLLKDVMNMNLHEDTGIWGRDTTTMQEIVSTIGELMSYTKVAFDHTPILYGGASKSFSRAPRGASDVFQSQSNNAKLSFTYVLCCSKKYGALQGYYIFPESVISKVSLNDMQTQGLIPSHLR